MGVISGKVTKVGMIEEGGHGVEMTPWSRFPFQGKGSRLSYTG